jgi:hypothetical protein
MFSSNDENIENLIKLNWFWYFNDAKDVRNWLWIL